MPAWTIPWPQTSSSPPPSFNGTVVALLHFDGANGSSTFTDEVGNSWTPTDATISTAESKFGGASGIFNGASFGQGLKSGPSGAFDLIGGDWEVECFVYVASVNLAPVIFSVDCGADGWNATNGAQFYVYCDSSGHPTGRFYNGTGTPTTVTASSLTIPTNAQCFVSFAYIHATQTLYCGIDGVVEAVAVSGTVTKPSLTDAYAGIGRRASQTTFTGGGATLTGYIDELRVTKGGANRIATFTPPTAAFTYP